MLRAEKITKSYGDLQILKGVDIQIEAGEIVSIVGKSGTGKSTLLHILGTLDKPDAGLLMIDGKDISQLKSKALAAYRNQKLGFVFQFHHLLAEFTALENICIPAFILGIPRQEAQNKAEKILEYLNLLDRKDHKPSELSGGEQQRVAIARALINDPRIIFADEPTGNLDTQTSNELHQLFRRLSKDLNQTFVIVTHNADLAQMSDRTYRMEDGILK